MNMNSLGDRAAALRDEILSKVVVDLDGPCPVDEAPCWIWAGLMGDDDYGRFRLPRPNRERFTAHRVVYELLVEPIPGGLELDHLCRNHPCVNPAHLEPVTHRVNMLRSHTFSAVNAAKEYCDNGHEFDLLNTYYRPGGTQKGRRECRTCNRERPRNTRPRVHARAAS